MQFKPNNYLQLYNSAIVADKLLYEYAIRIHNSHLLKLQIENKRAKKTGFMMFSMFARCNLKVAIAGKWIWMSHQLLMCEQTVASISIYKRNISKDLQIKMVQI